jgi:hypothetical protein
MYGSHRTEKIAIQNVGTNRFIVLFPCSFLMMALAEHAYASFHMILIDQLTSPFHAIDPEKKHVTTVGCAVVEARPS